MKTFQTNDDCRKILESFPQRLLEHVVNSVEFKEALNFIDLSSKDSHMIEKLEIKCEKIVVNVSLKAGISNTISFPISEYKEEYIREE